ncbi:MAG: phosphatidylserine decarboxylase [Acidobacteria bacterium RIFCSPHIGHO2_12_FULL_67_30]|nr:MAG: phosphatidylserine decarboxylase [Acidobacteria bacterium RIFCSPHIGHO2_02_FULL_67_57]OFV84319.1 MAG: phosphatidylserine decarboxylase [Acidobacteria bacterium RIFCSPHIGHO2_01_FULL_67_28]OFV88618.1 MAG: phosphatidylserine decarboxylase [Acidobacteria bacterium RIFCSPHIGHO2_12_FULL_67_30]
MVRTGFFFAAVPALAGGVLGWQGWWTASAPLLGLAGFVLFFFRDPERAVPVESGAIVAPADGKVLAVEETTVDGRPQTQVSIFLSIFDVHVNRAPIAGTIAEVRYRPGKFHIASTKRASRENERNEVVLESGGTRVIVRQIAGLVARRIEFWKKVGDQVERGQRLGMIRFGSRAEVVFDRCCRVEVRPGQHVRAGTSILAIRE